MNAPMFTQYWDGEQVIRMTIDDAGPHILVCDEFLYQVAGKPSRYFRLEAHQPDACAHEACNYPSHPFCWSDWLLHINADNAQFIYRVGKYDWQKNAWEASWPD